MPFVALGGQWGTAISDHFVVLAYEGLDPDHIAGTAEGILERLLDFWGPPAQGVGPFGGPSRLLIVVYPDPEAFGNDTGMYGFSRLPLPLFGTPKIPSFEEVTKGLEVEHSPGAVVACSPHEGLAELKLAEAISWIFLLLNMRRTPPLGGDRSLPPWFNIDGLARLSAAYMVGILEVSRGLSALWAKEHEDVLDLYKPPPSIGTDLWASAIAYMFVRDGEGSLEEGARNFFRCLAGNAGPDECGKYGNLWDEALNAWGSWLRGLDVAPAAQVLYRARRRALWLKFAFLCPAFSPNTREEFWKLYGKIEMGNGTLRDLERLDGFLSSPDIVPTPELVDALVPREASLMRWLNRLGGGDTEAYSLFLKLPALRLTDPEGYFRRYAELVDRLSG